MYKLYFLVFSLGLVLVSCSQEQKSTDDETLDVILRSPIKADGSIDSTILPIIAMENMTWDFDTIDQGLVVEHDFYFENTGKADLVIADVHTSCGCTVTEYDKKAIKPGKQSKLSLKFDSKDRYGKQDKSITIYANTYPNKTVINFTGFVKTKEN